MGRGLRAPGGLFGSEAHDRVRLLSAALLLIIALVGAVGTYGLFMAESQISQLVGDDIPAQRELLRLDRDLLEAQLGLEQSFQTQDLEERVQRIERFERSVARAGASWTDYREVATGFPDENRLWAGFEVMRAAWLEVTAELRAASETAASSDDPAVVRARGTAQARFAVLRAKAEEINERHYGPVVDRAGQRIISEISDVRTAVVVVLVLGLAGGVLLSRTSVRTTRAQQVAIEQRDRQRSDEARRSDFESRLHRALEMAKTEDTALVTLTGALVEVAPTTPAELLLADSSRAHLRQALTTDQEHRGPGCMVPTPSDCPAVNRGQTLAFESSGSFDACPYLRDRPGVDRSGLCVPVSIMGVASGVLHSTGPDNTRPDPEELVGLEYVAAKAGERIGLLRAFSRSEAQAASDPLTGLRNRRSLEERVQELTRSSTGYAVAYGDLDHFKRLNDTHGHETGDRALRLFARTLRETVRPEDIPARWGGEEFLVVFPSTSVDEAARALERVSEALALALASGTLPRFTVSFGVCDFHDADGLDALVATADSALLIAKRTGRNRVVISGREPVAESSAGTALPWGAS